MIKKLVLILGLVALSGCVKEHRNHGYGFNQNSLDSIKVGQTSMEGVVDQLGSPTSTSHFGDPTFYYISNVSEKIAFLEPKIVEQKVLSIKFDGSKRVSEIKQYTLDDANDVAFSQSRQEIRGNSLNPLEQIMSNVGKFNKKQKQF